MKNNVLGIYTNQLGYGAALVENQENYSFIVKEIYEGSPSIEEIITIVVGLKKKYQFKVVLNNQEFLEKIIKEYKYNTAIKNIDIEQSIFNVLATYKDDILIFSEDIKDKLIEKMNKFNLDTPHEHHVIQALFLAVEFKDVGVSWYRSINNNLLNSEY